MAPYTRQDLLQLQHLTAADYNIAVDTIREYNLHVRDKPKRAGRRIQQRTKLFSHAVEASGVNTIPTVISKYSTNRKVGGDYPYQQINGSNPNNLINITTEYNGCDKNNSKLLDFCLLNTRSVRNKTDKINNYVTDDKLDITALTETWL